MQMGLFTSCGELVFRYVWEDIRQNGDGIIVLLGWRGEDRIYTMLGKQDAKNRKEEWWYMLQFQHLGG
jgi:hypothetical protein